MVTPPQADLLVRVLGPLRVERGGRPVRLPAYLRARALLAYLLVEEGPHPRDFLADLLWPTLDLAAGRENLRRMLFCLRPVLGAGGIEATRQAVCALPGTGLTLDTRAFEVADAAESLAQRQTRLAVYGGHFLQGFVLDAAPAFELWLEARRAEWQTRHAQAALDLAGRLQRAGDTTSALATVRQLLGLQPWSEPGWQCLIRLLQASGRHEDALHELARCREALHEELGSTPSPETLALCAPAALPVRVDAQMPERRPLTVVFCEWLADGEEDPDELAAQLAPLRAVEDLLREGGAFLAPVPAGVLGYFGYPLAREGDARRAVAAALACMRIAQPGVHVRAGVHSGMAISHARAGQPDLAGQVSALAMRVREAAAPGEVLLSEASLRLVAHECVYRARGAVPEGAGRSMPVYIVDALAPGGPRWGGDMPLVGRAVEWQRLEALWQGAWRDAGGRLVLISGLAGCGKTRLLREFARRCETPQQVFHCYPEQVGRAFHPFLAWLSAHMARLNGASGLDADAVAVLESLLDEGDVPAGRFRHWSAEHWQRLAVEAMATLLAHEAAGGVVQLEDLHWADASTQALVAAVAQDVRQPLWLVTTRPEALPAGPARACAELVLPPLAPQAATQLAQLALGGKADAATLSAIVEVAGGIPLYLEEIARARRERGGRLPVTLHGILQARVDAAGSALPLLRLAACMGGQIDPAVLAEAAGCSAEALGAGVATLVAAGLLAEQGDAYVFRHELLREAAENAQPRTQRAAAHAALARALVARDATAAERDPGRLAWHYAQAGAPDAAVHCLAIAVRQAMAHVQYREAIGHCRAALSLLEPLPAPARAALERPLQLALGIALLAQDGYGAASAAEAFQRALVLAEAAEEDSAVFPACWGLWLGSSSLEDFDASRRWGERLVALARHSPGPNYLSHAYYALGNSLFCLGALAPARQALAAGVEAFVPDEADFALGEDPLVTNLSFLSWAHWFGGEHDAARHASQRAVARARSVGQPYTLCYALIFAAVLHRLRREPQVAEALAGEALTLAGRDGFALWRAAGTVVCGWARVAQGNAAGMDDIHAAVGMLGPVMGGIETMFLAHLLEACQLAGQTELGLQVAARGLEVAVLRKDRHYVAEFERLTAVFLAQRDAPLAEVQAWLQRAATSAGTLGSPSLMLRVRLSQWRYGSAGEAARTAATAALAAALQGFHDGQETGDLAEARAVLSQAQHMSDSF